MAGTQAGEGQDTRLGSREWGEAHSGPEAARAKQAADRSAGHWEVGRGESRKGKERGIDLAQGRLLGSTAEWENSA